MRDAYLTVLVASTAAVAGLVLWRMLQWHSTASRSRLINEWIWTLIPLAVLVGLLWVAVSK